MNDKKINETASNALKSALLTAAIESLVFSIVFALFTGFFLANEVYLPGVVTLIGSLGNLFQFNLRYKLYKDQ